MLRKGFFNATFLRQDYGLYRIQAKSLHLRGLVSCRVLERVDRHPEFFDDVGSGAKASRQFLSHFVLHLPHNAHRAVHEVARETDT